jgi:carboxymethylenebutenolidase
MKKILAFAVVILFSFLFLSWQLKKNQHQSVYRTDLISCFNMETPLAYKAEASQMDFANLHPSPRSVSNAYQLGKMIQFPSEDGKEASAYLIPAKKKSSKWLIVIQEWWGLNDNIKAESDKYYSDLGDFNILAVDMYDGKVAATPDSAMKLMRSANMDRMVSIVKGAIKYTGNNTSIYTLGWCFGGMWSLQTTILAGSQAKGCVMYYGRPETNMDKLKSINCDVIGFFGKKDQSPSQAVVDEFEKNMKAAGKNLNRNDYDAGHGFANPSNPSFVESARDDAYAKSIAFLKSH